MALSQFVDGVTDLDALHLNQMVDAIGGSAEHPIALAGIADALGAYEPLQNIRVGTANVLDYGADPTGAADSRQAIIDAQAAGHPYFPLRANGAAAEYRITDTILGLSHRRWHGHGEMTRIINDRTNAQRQKQTCILPGNLHPAYLLSGDMAGYDLDTIAAGDRVITCSTAGEAAKFSVGELVFPGSKTLHSGGVPRHAQLNKITAISGGDIALANQMAVAISDGSIWKIAGTDASSGWPIYAIEDFTVENLAFEGLAPFSPKGGIFGGAFRDLYLDVHQGVVTNTLTNFIVERISGRASGRQYELAFNSYNVVTRDYGLDFFHPTFSGDTLATPLNFGEQNYNIVLENLRSYIPPEYDASTSIAIFRSSNVLVKNMDWRHDGTNSTGASVIQFPETGIAAFPSRNIVFEGGYLSGSGVARLASVGDGVSGITDQNPQDISFNRTVLDGTPSTSAITYYYGSGHRCAAINRTNKSISITTTCAHPDMTGYQGVA